jgi:hypothetical protein
VLRSMLQRRGLEGARVYKGEVVATDCWPAILDPETAARVRFVLAGDRKTRRRRVDHSALLSGFVSCAECGALLACVRPAGNQIARYRCPEARRGGCGRGAGAKDVTPGRRRLSRSTERGREP